MAVQHIRHQAIQRPTRRTSGATMRWMLVWAMMMAWLMSGSKLAALPQDTWPRQVMGAGADGVAFIENRVCMQCHPQPFQDWLGSHHEQAMQPATEQTVRGNFNQSSFTHQGVTSRFFTREGNFVVHTQGPDGQMADFDILYTFGVEPLQQYLIPLPGGRLQSLSIAWDTQKQRWFHLYADEQVTPGEARHWTGLYHTWNVMCAECHSTNLQKNYDPNTNAYRTTWSAINVSCQACHGPGQRHVAWARKQAETGQTPDADQGDDKGLVVSFAKLDARGQVEQCARCHARRRRVSVDDQHGRPLLDDFMPEMLRAGLYHADGQILDEVYVYGSYLQSKMYHAGVSCTACHQPHSLQLRATGNALCVQCHQKRPDPRFPTLPSKAYDTPKHHFHATDASGGQCVNCHMPAKTYMVIDDRRDHSLRVPRPDLAEKLGTPDACTGCHQGRTAAWAADIVATWYGAKSTPHYADILAAGRAGQVAALPELMRLAGQTDQPAIVRATALELLGQYGTAGVKAMVTAVQDPDPLIRAAAVGAMDGLPARARLQPAAPMLRDTLRAIRIEAARVLAATPPEAFTAPQRQDFAAALSEFTAAQTALADTPSAHLNLAVLAAQTGQLAAAEQSYQSALTLDPAFLPARFNLANLYNQTGRNADAERVLRAALHYAPNEGELYYSLGLLLAEEKRLAEAADALETASALLPKRVRVHYNYGLTLQHLGRRHEAEAALLTAYRSAPNDARVLHALAVFYVQEQRWDQAAMYVEHLVRLYPEAPGPRQMLQQILQQQRK